MPEPISDRRRLPVPSKARQEASETRIDPAHVLEAHESEPPGDAAAKRPEAATAEVPGAPELGQAEPQAEQLHAQAAQLADHLRRRQHWIDHREARLNAQMAQLEVEARGARLLIAQRQEELRDKEQQLHRRLARFAADETSREQKQKQADDILVRQQRIRKQTDKLEAQRRRLATIEAAAANAQAESDQLRRTLVEDRKRQEEQIRAERERMAADHRRQTAELDERRKALTRRSRHVDQCRASIEQHRAELRQMHRETLEIRLATEELWVQLAGSAPPATLTQSLGHLRAKLTEEYRLANAELAAQKKELQEIRQELAERHDALVCQKRDLDAWATRQQEELRRQAERLLARERQIGNYETDARQQARQWQAQELGYREEIRRLKAQLERPVAVA